MPPCPAGGAATSPSAYLIFSLSFRATLGLNSASSCACQARREGAALQHCQASAVQWGGWGAGQPCCARFCWGRPR